MALNLSFLFVKEEEEAAGLAGRGWALNEETVGEAFGNLRASLQSEGWACGAVTVSILQMGRLRHRGLAIGFSSRIL